MFAVFQPAAGLCVWIPTLIIQLTIQIGEETENSLETGQRQVPFEIAVWAW